MKTVPDTVSFKRTLDHKNHPNMVADPNNIGAEQNIVDLEKGIIERMFADNHIIPRTLFKQWRASIDKKIEVTRTGFFVHYTLPPDAPTLNGKPNFQVTNIRAEISGLKYGAGFVLFVRKGRIDMLEGYTYEEGWPAFIEMVNVTFEATVENWDQLTK